MAKRATQSEAVLLAGDVPVPVAERVQAVMAWLQRNASTRIRESMGPRYGIHTEKAYGIRMAAMQGLAKQLGRNHQLAAALWQTGWYEARIIACYVEQPELLTVGGMDQWCRDFDNWAICDTVCFKLFDQSPHAYGRAAAWAKRRAEFERRAGFVLMACLAAHDKRAGDEPFLAFLPQIERGAADDRNFVKKGVSWALRVIGRRGKVLNAEVVACAERLAASPEAASRWIGRDVLRDLKRHAERRARGA